VAINTQPAGSSLLSGNQQRFLAGAARTTGLNPNVLGAWLRNEEPKTDQNTDPAGHGRYNFLNVGITDSKPYGAASTYWNTTPEAAGTATGKWLLGQLAIPGFGKSAPSIQALRNVAGKSPAEQIRAIQQSGWASGGEKAMPGLFAQITGSGGIPTQSAAPAATGAAPQPTLQTAQQPGAPNPLSALSLGALQTSFDTQRQANQRSLDALGKLSGHQVQAAAGPDLTSLIQQAQTSEASAPTQAKPQHVSLAPHAKTPTGLDAQGQKAVELAKTYLGTKYVFGGASPKTGFDCSGLLAWTWNKLGVKIPRTSEQQWHAGTPVAKDAVQPGDAVFFVHSDGDVGHVGMAIGNGQYIEAPHTGDVVKIANLADASNFIGARRFA
jgi:cell wall-associated NlpC family hydrolase